MITKYQIGDILTNNEDYYLVEDIGTDVLYGNTLYTKTKEFCYIMRRLADWRSCIAKVVDFDTSTYIKPVA